MSEITKPRLVIRNATPKDVFGVFQLVKRVYHDMPPYPFQVILGQINNYPEGHFVAVIDGQVIGYCATFRISGKKALAPHSWKEITGGGYGATHDPNGDYLYGYEVCVDPTKRRYRIGQRFYDERKKLCQRLGLKGIIFGGRLPLLRRKFKTVGSPENYIEKVKDKTLNDPVLSFQLRNEFEVIGVLSNYLPGDHESMGYAAHLMWKNPRAFSDDLGKQTKTASAQHSVRVATVQYGQRKISSFEEFEQMVTYFVDVVADYRSDFVLFPELFTLQLLSVDNEAAKPHEAIRRIAGYTERLRDFFYGLAIKFNVNIIAGSTPTIGEDGKVYNVSYVFLRDGSIHEQAKIHPTPNERYWWNIEGGKTVSAINTDCGPIGILICYDAEFPELSRHLADQGINILFVPYLTDERQSYCRVRYCAQARAVENQLYVVMSGNVGNLPNVNNMDIHYGQSCILTPCDFGFARDGIAADTSPNVETVAFADLRIDTLREARNRGTVQNLADRRHDLYSVVWNSSQ